MNPPLESFGDSCEPDRGCGRLQHVVVVQLLRVTVVVILIVRFVVVVIAPPLVLEIIGVMVAVFTRHFMTGTN